jgi:hypothetical protein
MHGESGHPRQNMALVTGSNVFGASTPPKSACHPVGRKFAQSRAPQTKVKRIAVVRWTG